MKTFNHYPDKRDRLPAKTEVEELIGQILTRIHINKSKAEIRFYTNTNRIYKMYHSQDCCERVYVEDIIGDLDDLLRVPILMAEEVSNQDNPIHIGDHFTWTFYKFATINGYVTIRWYGTSNGYYSESVDFEESY